MNDISMVSQRDIIWSGFLVQSISYVLLLLCFFQTNVKVDFPFKRCQQTLQQMQYKDKENITLWEQTKSGFL